VIFSTRAPVDWCCLGFEAGYENAGNRGHSYLIGRDSLGTPEFISQFRSLETGYIEKITSETPITLVSELRINFCPTCGTNLANFYGARVDVLYRQELEVGFLNKLGNSERLVASPNFPDPN
jgi:hypothetical protein